MGAQDGFDGGQHDEFEERPDGAAEEVAAVDLG